LAAVYFIYRFKEDKDTGSHTIHKPAQDSEANLFEHKTEHMCYNANKNIPAISKTNSLSVMTPGIMTLNLKEQFTQN